MSIDIRATGRLMKTVDNTEIKHALFVLLGE